jgi:hypothetical protein
VLHVQEAVPSVQAEQAPLQGSQDPALLYPLSHVSQSELGVLKPDAHEVQSVAETQLAHGEVHGVHASVMPELS